MITYSPKSVFTVRLFTLEKNNSEFSKIANEFFPSATKISCTSGLLTGKVCYSYELRSMKEALSSYAALKELNHFIHGDVHITTNGVSSLIASYCKCTVIPVEPFQGTCTSVGADYDIDCNTADPC